MSNIVQAKVDIRGVRPLLWHRFGPEALPLQKQELTGVAGNDPEEWRRTVLVSKDGQLYLDPSQVFGGIRDGSKHTKKGRGSIQPLVTATLQVLDERVLIDRYFPGFPNGHAFNVNEAEAPPSDPSEPVYLDVRGVRNPSTKARNVRYRVAASRGWACEFTLIWDKTIVARAQMEAALYDTGQFVGIGNGRSIGMGRFEVLSFKVIES